MRTRSRIGAGSVEMPLSSMVDVVFLLLVYFIVTQKPIMEETLLQADLPGGKSIEPPREASFLLISVDKGASSGYKVNGMRWNAERLFEYLKIVAENDKRQPVVITCGPYAKHGKLVKLLDACADAGLTNLNIKDDDTSEFGDGVPGR